MIEEIGAIRRNSVSGCYEFWDGDEWSSSFGTALEAREAADVYIDMKKEYDGIYGEDKPRTVDKFIDFFCGSKEEQKPFPFEMNGTWKNDRKCPEDCYIGRSAEQMRNDGQTIPESVDDDDIYRGGWLWTAQDKTI